MASKHELKITVFQLRQMLDRLPPDMPVEFSPITDAWLGCTNPVHAKDIEFYDDDGNNALPSQPGAHAVISIFEMF